MTFLDSAYISLGTKLATSPLLATVDINSIKNGSGDTFKDVNTSVTTLGQDTYQMLMLIGGFGGVIMLIVAFIYFAIAGNGANKEQAKGKIVTVLIAVIGIFAAVFIVGLAQKIGTGIDTNGGTP